MTRLRVSRSARVWRGLAFALAAAPLFCSVACAQSAFDAPPYANSGVAITDDANALFLNPAAAGLRRGPELALSVLGAPRASSADPIYDAPLGRAALSLGPLGLDAIAPYRGRVSYGMALAGGQPALRFGCQLQSVTASALAAAEARSGGPEPPPLAQDGRVADLRAGLLTRPSPWLSLGAVADHVAEPRLVGDLLEREYVLGAGLRPLAWNAARAHTAGTRFTLGADVAMREGEALSRAHVRVGAELEIVPGILLRGAVEDHGGARFGISLLGGRSSLHVDAHDPDRAGHPAGATTVTFHAAEDRTVLAKLERPRVARIAVGGPLADESITSVSFFDQGATVSTLPVRRELERAARDPRTRGVLLELEGCGGMASIEELRPKVAAVRAAGKPVVAYLENGGTRADLYLAAACDRVVTSPESFWAGLGLHGERRYYRQILADWGVRIDRTSYGKYKSAYRNYSVDSTSSADRESIEHGLDVVDSLFMTTVAHDRHMSEQRLRTIVDGRAWRAEELAKAGLVDSIGYREDALRILGRLAGAGNAPRMVALGRIPEARPEWRVPRGIAIVFAGGDIETGRSGNDLLNGAYMGSQTMVRTLNVAFHNPEARAVVLRIDSPGGSAVAADVIAHAAARFARETRKPLVVSMGRVAASGGYHIAIPGQRIFADRYTITGSIGVLSVRYSLQGWLRAHHVRVDDFNRGAYMNAWSTGHDWTPKDQASADSATYADYTSFVAAVARGRGLSWDEVDAVAQGRVWLGEDALERRLVDSIGGLDQAIDEARRRAGIPAGQKIDPIEYHRPGPGLLQAMLGSWVRAEWERDFHLPDPGETRFGLDPDALTIE